MEQNSTERSYVTMGNLRGLQKLICVIWGETDNTNKDAETDGELRIEGTEYDEFTAKLKTAESKSEHMLDAENETNENASEGNALIMPPFCTCIMHCIIQEKNGGK